ncbi:MAG: hypothetical protein ACFFD2_06325 [Promethearchaeota archaeon]
MVLERKIGEIAYKKYEQYKIIALIFMTIYLINFIYYFFPLPLPLFQFFPWSWWISIIIGILIAILEEYL